MDQPHNDTYLAGLWQGDLLEALSWRVPGTADRLHPRPEGCNIPSWSWVSVNSKASVPYMGEVENRIPSPKFSRHTPY